MTLELSQLTHQVRNMGEVLARRQRCYADLVDVARQWLAEHAAEGERLQDPARRFGAAIPTKGDLDAVEPLPGVPDRFTVVAADGSQIQPDRHGTALYHIVNVGSLLYRHGSGEAPEATSEARLGYTEDDLYEAGVPVAGNLLDVRRDLAELERLAQLCEREAARPVVALADGSILLWVLKDLPGGARRQKVLAYLDLLERIRRADAVIGGFVSRPGYNEVSQLLYLGSVGGDLQSARESPNPLGHLPDRVIFASLPAGARSALFVSPREVNKEHYLPQGHEVRFFYLNVADQGKPSAIARVEVPAWVAEDTDKLNLIHGAIVTQAHLAGDYPYALVRADELAYISGAERSALGDMVASALMRAGALSGLSPKAHYKRLTRHHA